MTDRYSNATQTQKKRGLRLGLASGRAAWPLTFAARGGGSGAARALQGWLLLQAESGLNIIMDILCVLSECCSCE